MATWIERQTGLLLAFIAISWAAYHAATVHAFQGAFFRLGPLQLFMAGLMVWLHGKYRAVHFTRKRREFEVRFRDF